MRTLAFVVLSLIASATVAAASEPPRPSWCREGFVCVPREEIVRDAEFHFELREEILTLRGRARRFGWTVGPGIGVSGVVDDDFDVQWVSSAGFYVVWGFRFGGSR